MFNTDLPGEVLFVPEPEDFQEKVNVAQDFVDQNFTRLPEGQSEQLVLNGYQIIVNADPLRAGYFYIAVYNQDYFLGGLNPTADDVNSTVARVVNNVADRAFNEVVRSN